MKTVVFNADAQAERERGDQREPGILDEHAGSVADVLEQRHLQLYESGPGPGSVRSGTRVLE